MRVTAQVKAATRARILEAARRLFAEKGFEDATTRDLATAAGIAAGTLFNYFPSKEAVVAALAGDLLGDGLAGFDADAASGESLEEDLFSLVAASLRRLRPLRKHLPSLLESSLSPLVEAPGDEAAGLRSAHLEAASHLAVRHGLGPLSPVALHLCWTLFTGVLVFWAGDASPKQEDTLALLDESLSMFAGWLRQQARPRSSTRTR